MKKLMENWRRLIKENEEEEQALAELLPPAEIPEELFHATRPPLLSKIAIDGLRDFTDYSKHGAGQVGVSFTTQFDAVNEGQFGNLVIVFDGQKMAQSGQYSFRPHQDPSVGTDEAELRVEMVDSASDSGSGIDQKVDSLGTAVPFEYAKKLVFIGPGLQKFELKWLKETYPHLPIASFDKRTGEMVEYE